MMPSVEQIQQDIESLPQDAQVLLVDFIDILKKRYLKPLPEPSFSQSSVYQKFKESGFIGGVSIEEDLSTTYKQVLSEKWSTKYDHG